MKMENYLVLFVTMMIFLEFVGIPTGLSGTLATFGVHINDNTHNLMVAESSFENSDYYAWIFGAAGILVILAGVGAVVVGFFAKGYDPSLVVLPLVISVGTLFASTAFFILTYVNALPGSPSWAVKLIAIIFIPLTIGFLWSCVKFFRGLD